MRSKTAFALIIIAALTLCIAIAQPAAAASDEEEAMQVPYSWVNSFTNGDFESFSSLYLHSSNTSEFGPVNGYPFLYKGWDQIGADWKLSFATIPKGALSFSIHNPQVTMIGKDVAITTVYQTAVYTDPNTKEQNIGQLRQTLVLQKVNGKWLIVHHHSSQFPTK